MGWVWQLPGSNHMVTHTTMDTLMTRTQHSSIQGLLTRTRFTKRTRSWRTKSLTCPLKKDTPTITTVIPMNTTVTVMEVTATVTEVTATVTEVTATVTEVSRNPN